MIDLAVHTDELVRGPLVGGSVEDTSAIELEELEALLLSLGAVALALGKVVQHGAVVRLGPGVPGEGKVAASVDLDGGLARSSFLVADDVGVAERVRLNEAYEFIVRSCTYMIIIKWECSPLSWFFAYQPGVLDSL